MEQSEFLKDFSKERFISLGTFKKSGERIDTPVIFGIHENKLIVSTKSFTGKLKRIKNNPNVVFFPSNARGERKGDDFKGAATILSEEIDKFAYDAIKKKNGIIFKIWRVSGKIRHHKFVFISIIPIKEVS